MYKVIETIEDGVKTISIVSSNWVHNGVLYWPHRNDYEKYLKKRKPPEKIMEIV